jgi:hypothetical protein
MPRKSQAASSDDATMRADATEQSRAAAEPSDWLSLALQHHDQIRSAFESARKAPAGGARISAMKGLAVVLNGHSLAEEIVLYPALTLVEKAKHADKAYAEQKAAKIEMAELERIDPTSKDWLEKLNAICDAVLQHMAEEESTWFLEIKANANDQAGLTARYKEEFDRYTRTGIVATNGV